jgi:hypothetical protein
MASGEGSGKQPDTIVRGAVRQQLRIFRRWVPKDSPDPFLDSVCLFLNLQDNEITLLADKLYVLQEMLCHHSERWEQRYDPEAEEALTSASRHLAEAYSSIYRCLSRNLADAATDLYNILHTPDPDDAPGE